MQYPHECLKDRQTGGMCCVQPGRQPQRGVLHRHRRYAKYLPQVVALFAPFVNSYRRLVRFNAAPINVQWGYDNRTCGIRVPTPSPKPAAA